MRKLLWAMVLLVLVACNREPQYRLHISAPTLEYNSYSVPMSLSDCQYIKDKQDLTGYETRIFLTCERVGG